MTNQPDLASTNATATKTDQFVLEHLPLVKEIAIRISGGLSPRPNLDMLLSAGIRGVIAAARTHEHNRHIPARTYAAHHIAGAILDELAASDGMSEDLHLLQRALNEAAADAPSQHPASSTGDGVAGSPQRAA